MYKTNEVYEASIKLALDNYKQSRAAIMTVVADMANSDNEFRGYFQQTGTYLMLLMDHFEALQSPEYYDQAFETLLVLNHELYEEITEPGYQTSYVNPTFAVKAYGTEMGQFLSGVGYIFREYVGLVYENRLFDMNEMNDLYLLVYRLV